MNNMKTVFLFFLVFLTGLSSSIPVFALDNQTSQDTCNCDTTKGQCTGVDVCSAGGCSNTGTDHWSGVCKAGDLGGFSPEMGYSSVMVVSIIVVVLAVAWFTSRTKK